VVAFYSWALTPHVPGLFFLPTFKNLVAMIQKLDLKYCKNSNYIWTHLLGKLLKYFSLAILVKLIAFIS
jgi:hypothetical protein